MFHRTLLGRVPQSFISALRSRTIMSDAPSKHLFLVYAPDLTDPDAFARRTAVRERHIANVGPLADEGFISALRSRGSPIET
jgi:hypothetical protein